MRKVGLLTTAGLLATAATAAASTTMTATPNRTGRPTTLHVNVDGTTSPINGRLPRALQVTTARGFRVNLQAVAKRCSEESAKLNECPAGSLIGRGGLVVGVTQTTPTGPQTRTVNIPLTVYLNSSSRILAIAKIFGWQVVPATLNARHGLIVRFDPLPAGPAFAGVSYTLKGITLDFGATRRVTARIKGKRVTRRVNLITNPSSCTGTWESSVTLTIRADNSTVRIPTPTPCAKS